MMEKPNFEKISKVLQGNLMIREELLDKEINHDWVRLFQNEEYFPFRLSLEVLLNEYHLEEYFPDFMLLGFIFVEVSAREDPNSFQNLNGKDWELLKALDTLLDHSDGLSIDIYWKQIHQISIKNPRWVYGFREMLYKYLTNKYTRNYESIYLDKEKDWKKFIKHKLAEIKDRAPKKGRPIRNRFIKPIVFSLWCYVQWFTDLKKEEGAIYSNRQAKFIFRFLEVLGLADINISKKEDSIGYYLRSYLKSLEARVKKSRPTEERINKIKKEKSEKEQFLKSNQDSISDSWKKSLQRDISNLEKTLEIFEENSKKV